MKFVECFGAELDKNNCDYFFITYVKLTAF